MPSAWGGCTVAGPNPKRIPLAAADVILTAAAPAARAFQPELCGVKVRWDMNFVCKPVASLPESSADETPSSALMFIRECLGKYLLCPLKDTKCTQYVVSNRQCYTTVMWFDV